MFVDAVDGSKLQHADHHLGLTRGEVGCFLSHVGMWLRLSGGPHRMALILEDDANIRLPEQWHHVEAAMRAAPPDWDILYLGHNNQGSGSPGVQRAVGDVWGTHAMLLTKKATTKLLEHYGSVGHGGVPVDLWMSRVPGLRRYCVIPALVNPFDLNDSETQRTR